MKNLLTSHSFYACKLVLFTHQLPEDLDVVIRSVSDRKITGAVAVLTVSADRLYLPLLADPTVSTADENILAFSRNFWDIRLL